MIQNLENYLDFVVIEAAILAMEKFPIEVSLPYDSKRDTGFVGIMEEETGGKAYLNSLLQILFHIPKFRRVEITYLIFVFLMPNPKE